MAGGELFDSGVELLDLRMAERELVDLRISGAALVCLRIERLELVDLCMGK